MDLEDRQDSISMNIRLSHLHYYYGTYNGNVYYQAVYTIILDMQARIKEGCARFYQLAIVEVTGRRRSAK